MYPGAQFGQLRTSSLRNTSGTRRKSARVHLIHSMIERAVAAKRESKTLDFKRSFDPGSTAEWCELVKDLVAIANSGGGYIIIGVNDDGTYAPDAILGPVLALDPAVLTDKVARYTGVQFDGCSIVEGQRDGRQVAVLVVTGATRPLIFEKPGTYPSGDGKQKTAFGTGTLYVRHSAKSEPATSDDISRIVERLLQAVRKEWMAGVRRVVNAPIGSAISVTPPSVRHSSDPEATPIKITDDPNAPEYRLVDPDQTHPWRQKELIANANLQLPTADSINQFDVLAVRQLYDIDTKPQFFHKPRFAAPQYSPEFLDWLLQRYAGDTAFFQKARQEYRRPR
jgi:hypothetical protein